MKVRYSKCRRSDEDLPGVRSRHLVAGVSSTPLHSGACRRRQATRLSHANRRRRAEHTYRKDAPVQGNTQLTTLTQLAAEQCCPLVTLLPVILLGVVFYFLLFRPKRWRQQQQLQMQRQVEPSQHNKTTAG